MSYFRIPLGVAGKIKGHLMMRLLQILSQAPINVPTISIIMNRPITLLPLCQMLTKNHLPGHLLNKLVQISGQTAHVRSLYQGGRIQKMATCFIRWDLRIAYLWLRYLDLKNFFIKIYIYIILISIVTYQQSPTGGLQQKHLGIICFFIFYSLY